MTVVTVQIKNGWQQEMKQRLAETLQLAIAEALQATQDDQQIRIIEYAPENLLIPPGKSEQYMVIEIAMFLGRSLATKKRLYSTINKKLNELHIESNDIFIILHEIPMENFGVEGGIPANEVNFNYTVKI